MDGVVLVIAASTPLALIELSVNGPKPQIQPMWCKHRRTSSYAKKLLNGFNSYSAGSRYPACTYARGRLPCWLPKTNPRIVRECDGNVKQIYLHHMR